MLEKTHWHLRLSYCCINFVLGICGTNKVLGMFTRCYVFSSNGYLIIAGENWPIDVTSNCKLNLYGLYKSQ